MFNKTQNQRQEYLINWLERLDDELERLNKVMDSLESKQQSISNRVVAMDYSLEIHEMDFEYLKANMKTKKKGNK